MFGGVTGPEGEGAITGGMGIPGGGFCGWPEPGGSKTPIPFMPRSPPHISNCIVCEDDSPHRFTPWAASVTAVPSTEIDVHSLPASALTKSSQGFVGTFEYFADHPSDGLLIVTDCKAKAPHGDEPETEAKAGSVETPEKFGAEA